MTSLKFTPTPEQKKIKKVIKQLKAAIKICTKVNTGYEAMYEDPSDMEMDEKETYFCNMGIIEQAERTLKILEP